MRLDPFASLYLGCCVLATAYRNVSRFPTAAASASAVSSRGIAPPSTNRLTTDTFTPASRDSSRSDTPRRSAWRSARRSCSAVVVRPGMSESVPRLEKSRDVRPGTAAAASAVCRVRLDGTRQTRSTPPQHESRSFGDGAGVSVQIVTVPVLGTRMPTAGPVAGRVPLRPGARESQIQPPATRRAIPRSPRPAPAAGGSMARCDRPPGP
jgi:hypothetical protein